MIRKTDKTDKTNKTLFINLIPLTSHVSNRIVSRDEKQTLSSKFRCFSHSLQGASASSKNQRRRLIIAVQVSLGSFSNNFDELTHDITNYMKMGRIIISIFESTYKIILRDSRQKNTSEPQYGGFYHIF